MCIKCRRDNGGHAELGSVVSSTFYGFLLLFLTRGPTQNRSKHILHRPYELQSLEAPFTRDIRWIFIVRLGSDFQVDWP